VLWARDATVEAANAATPLAETNKIAPFIDYFYSFTLLGN
jgi:hypothetical protein